MAKIRSLIENRSALFVRWIASYTVILLLPILICVIYYFQSFRVLDRRTSVNQQLILENAGERFDAAVSDVLNAGSYLKINDHVSGLTSAPYAGNTADILHRHYLVRDLKALQVSNALFSKIYVYFPESSYVVTSDTVYQTDLITHMEGAGISFDTWQDMVEQLAVSSMTVCEKDGDLIIGVRLKTSHKKPVAVLAVSIRSEAFGELFQNDLLLEYACSFSIISQGESLLVMNDVSGMGETRAMQALEIYLSDQERAEGVFNVEKAVAGCYTSLIPETYLVSVLDRTRYLSDMRRLYMIFASALTICLAGGFAAVILFARRNYRPVAEIVDYIDKNGTAPVGRNENEYALIMQILEANRSELGRQQVLQREVYLQKMLSGEIPAPHLTPSASAQLGLFVPEGQTVVLLVQPSDPDILEPGDGKTQVHSGQTNGSRLIYFIIDNVLDELLQPLFPDHYGTVMGGVPAMMISVPVTMDNPLEQLEGVIDRFFEILGEGYHIPMHAGLGGMVDTADVALSYRQAGSALEYALLAGENLCIYDRMEKEPRISVIPLHSAEYVENLLFEGNESGINEYFRNIRKEAESQKPGMMDLRSCIYFFYHTTSRIRLSCQRQFGVVPASLETGDLETLNGVFFEFLSQICLMYVQAAREIAELKEKQTSARWGTDICTFIESNYFDVNMNLNFIAAHFELTPSYLSKKFKETYYRSVVDYLYEVRINRAKELMKASDLKVSDLAGLTGFADSNAFIRIFKKFTGNTPGKYAAELRQQEKES